MLLFPVIGYDSSSVTFLHLLCIICLEEMLPRITTMRMTPPHAHGWQVKVHLQTAQHAAVCDTFLPLAIPEAKCTVEEPGFSKLCFANNILLFVFAISHGNWLPMQKAKLGKTFQHYILNDVLLNYATKPYNKIVFLIQFTLYFKTS